MKKLLSLLFVAVLGFNAFAGDVVFNPAETRGTNTQANAADEMVLNGVTISCSKGAFNPTTSGNPVNEYRFAKNSETTISCASKITKIVMTTLGKISSSYYSGAGFAAMDGMTLSEDSLTVTWTGNANSVVFTASKHQVRATLITVTIDGEVTPTISAPTFSPAGGTFYTAQQVTINAAEGATIYYTTNGNDPTTSSSTYSSPIDVTQTTTIKAIATKDGLTSTVASATYTIESVQTVDNIAAYAALADKSYAAISNPVTVFYVNGYNVWVKDNSGYMCIYGKVAGDMNYKNGDIIPGGFGGYKKTYNGGPEMTFNGDQDLFGFQTATAGTAVTPDVLTTTGITENIWGHYVTIKNATVTYSGSGKNFTINDAAGSVAGYNTFSGITIPNDGANYDITGIVAKYVKTENGTTTTTIQLLPTAFDKIINIDDLPVVNSISAFLNETNEKTDVKFANPVTVVLHAGNYLYVKDNSGWLLIYGQFENQYNNGDQLTGIAGNWYTRYGMKQMVPIVSTFGEATPGTPVEPETYVVELIDESMVHTYMYFENCSIAKKGDSTREFEMTDENGDKLNLYMTLNNIVTIGDDFDFEAKYNVTGFLALYKKDENTATVMQLYPSAIEKVGGEQPVPGDVNGDGVCNASDVTALYNYILNNDDSAIVNGDQNNDNVINTGDVTTVYNIILK